MQNFSANPKSKIEKASERLMALADCGIVSSMFTPSLFLPTIMTALVYTAHEAQLWYALPFAAALVTFILCALVSDSWGERGTVTLFPLSLAIVGYGFISNSTDHMVQ
ncbi:major facilitator superfamily transporter [Seiridium cupressi]